MIGNSQGSHSPCGMRLGTCLAVAAVAFCLAGCASAPPSLPAPDVAAVATVANPQPPSQRPPPEDILGLLHQAETLDSPEREQFLLRAARLTAEQGDWIDVGTLLDRTPADRLPDALAAKHAHLLLEQRYRSGQINAALTVLESMDIDADLLDGNEKRDLMLLRADVLQSGQRYLASVRERVSVAGLLKDEARVRNEARLWTTLMEVPLDTLRQQAERSTTHELRGWLSLAALAKRYQDNIEEQHERLRQWQGFWQGHPASDRLPRPLAMLPQLIRQAPRQIALLVPVTGPLAAYGRAIRDGLLAARLTKGRATPAVIVYDTHGADIGELLRRAEDEGANFIVGPLQRDNVTDAARQRHPAVPVLALNRLPDNAIRERQRARDFYQFGLAPEDEVAQIAELAAISGHRRALLIYPASAWGERNASAFRRDWLARGGLLSAVGGYPDTDDYSPFVGGLLGIEASQGRADALRKTINASFEFTPRRRQDIDFVALFAAPAQAKGLNPALSFLYADDLPVYSTSAINEDITAGLDLLDLRGIRFCDMPYRLLDDIPAKTAIETAWPNIRTFLAPFYAMGFDSYHLAARLAGGPIPDYRHFGATGTLVLDQRGVIRRKLLWAHIGNDGIRTMSGTAAGQ